MSTADAVVIGDRLSIADVDAVARRSASVAISPAGQAALERSYAFLQSVAASDAAVYGLTTGCGPLAGARIDAARRAAFQRNLVRSHAVTLGAAHPTRYVRAAMLVRAHVFARGGSGVDPATAALLVAMLNAGIHPIVREIGGVGASGDLLELAQIALAVLGEGDVERGGVVVAAAAALRAADLAPLTPRYREGLALINGTSFHTGAGAVLVAGARRVTAAAEVAAAIMLEALGAHAEALDPALHAARPHAGQGAVAERLRARLAGSALVRTDGGVASRQDPYTLRCVAQIIGPALDAIEAAAAVVETELAAVSDNPLFLAAERRVVHGGNFHGQPVAMALDQLKTALVVIGAAAERRIARALDPALNGVLPPFLVRGDAGVQSGCMGLQYCATTLAAENAALAAPASVRSISTNNNNQDFVSMAMLAARQAGRALDNTRRIIAIELFCAAQALDLRDATHAGAGTRTAHGAVRAAVPPLSDDRLLGPDIAALEALIESDRLAAC
jgi:histidine ammonia-lyase